MLHAFLKYREVSYPQCHANMFILYFNLKMRDSCFHKFQTLFLKKITNKKKAKLKSKETSLSTLPSSVFFAKFETHP